MTDVENDPQRALAVRVAAATTPEEKDALRRWIEQLLAIAHSELPAGQKAKDAVALTVQSRVVWPAAKLIGREAKRLAWDERTFTARMGIGGAAVGLALFGGQGAGIAALGTAIGVPLWVVFGAGAAFLGVLYEEITGTKPPAPATTYRVIEAEEERASADRDARIAVRERADR